MGFLFAEVAVMVVGAGCSVVLGLAGSLGRSGAPVLFSAGGSTDAAAKAKTGYYIVMTQC